MAIINRYFLIDYENVGERGLEGFFRLSEADRVLLFYTEKANRIGLDFLQNLLRSVTKAELLFCKVPFGNQALDLQLASFLGGIAVHANKGDFLAIISKDKGYSCLPPFWQNQESKARICLADSIESAMRKDKDESSPQVETVPVNNQVTSDAGKNGKSVSLMEKKSELNKAVIQALSKEKYDMATVGNVASTVARHFKEAKIRQKVYLDLISAYGQKKGLQIYTCIKPLLQEFEKNMQQKGSG